MKKRKFDYYNFVYAFGACVVIIGAIAKFLEFEYSDELFVAGLSVEVIVFAFSSISFEEAEKKDVNYHWENVFPELLQEVDASFDFLKVSGQNESHAELVRQKQVLKEKVNEIQMEIDALNKSFNDLTSYTNAASTYMAKMNIANEGYENHMMNLKKNMHTMNDFFEAFNTALSSIK